MKHSRQFVDEIKAKVAAMRAVKGPPAKIVLRPVAVGAAGHADEGCEIVLSHGVVVLRALVATHVVDEDVIFAADSARRFEKWLRGTPPEKSTWIRDVVGPDGKVEIRATCGTSVAAFAAAAAEGRDAYVPSRPKRFATAPLAVFSRLLRVGSAATVKESDDHAAANSTVQFEARPGFLRVASSDESWLAVSEAAAAVYGAPAQFAIDKTMADILRRELAWSARTLPADGGNVEMFAADSYVWLDMPGGRYMICPLRREGGTRDYEKVVSDVAARMRDGSPSTVVVNGRSLLEGVKSGLPFVRRKQFPYARLMLSPGSAGAEELRIKVETVFGHSISEIGAGQASGAALEARINLDHLRKFAEAIGPEGEIRLSFSESDRAFLMEGCVDSDVATNRAVAMPVARVE